MEKKSHLAQLRRCISSVQVKPLGKTGRLISNDTTASSSELQKASRKERKDNFNKSIEDQINKAKMLLSNARNKMSNDKTRSKNFETTAIGLQDIKQRNKFIQIHNLLKNNKAPRSNSHQHFPTEFSAFLTPQSSKIFEKDMTANITSPKQKVSKNISNPFIPKYLSVQDLDQARIIDDSFILGNETNLQVSIVKETVEEVSDYAPCEDKVSEFKILKFVDEGFFGKVYLAQSHRNAAVYSIKSIYIKSLESSAISQLIREIKIQSFINHPNIVKIYNFFVDEDSAYLVLQPCLDGNLYNYMKKHERVSQKKVREWIKQVCSAVQYLHKNDIIHRDLKPQNILLHQNMIKICDFGWAIHSPLLRETLCGTPLYTPPEIVCKKPYDSKIDIWSIGVLTYELLYGSIPFEIRQMQDMSKIVDEQVFFPRDISVTESAVDFISKCMNKNPMERPNIHQLITHQFLNKLEKYRWTVM